MIPVEASPEPTSFQEKVRLPGGRFLAEVPNPTTSQWKSRAYWQRMLPDMRKAYKGICSYSSLWIPHSTGNHSVDHFIPKSQEPYLAYEWNNYRYASARFNSRKGLHPIADPFQLFPDSFVLNFKSFFILPNPILESFQKQQLLDTIEYLKLNDDDDLVNERQDWYLSYQDGHISFEHLSKKALFIAYELTRQGLHE